MPVVLFHLLLACTGADGPAADTGAGDSPGAPTWWYRDGDGDGWGVASDRVYEVSPGPGWATAYPDCDDGDAATYPGAPETWYDGVDQDCDGGGNDDDADGDGYAWDGVGGDDCNDDDVLIHPDAVDICASGVDEDCDGELAVCGFVEEMKVGDAAVHIERDPSSYEMGHFGLWLGDAGDADADGISELLVQVNEQTPDDDTKDNPYDYVFYLIEPPSKGTAAVEASAVARWTTTIQGWSVDSFRNAAGEGDLDRDGFLDYFVAMQIAAEGSDDDSRDRFSRVFLVEGPTVPLTNLDESASFLDDPPDPWGVDVFNSALGLLQEPTEGDDWTLAVGHQATYHREDVWTAAHLVTNENFEGERTWDETPAIWSTGGPDYEVYRMCEVGDLDGDGVADLAFQSRDVSSLNYVAPRVWVVYGPDLAERSLWDADVVVDADGGDHADVRFKLLPDWERSGAPVVAARLETDEGAGWFFYELPASGALRAEDAFASIEDTEDYGINGDLVYGGDLDADGEDEVALGAFPYVKGEQPEAVVLMGIPTSGVVDPADHDVIIHQDDPFATEPAYSTEIGEAMLGNIDFNADGFPDLLISEPYWDDDVSGNWPYGRLSVFHGGPVGY